MRLDECRASRISLPLAARIRFGVLEAGKRAEPAVADFAETPGVVPVDVEAAQAAGQPVISVDTKKKELVGNFKNGGTDYRPKGDPRRVNVHDFVDKEKGKVVPYGVYDVTANAAFVSVGITAATAEFAVEAIRTWRECMVVIVQNNVARFIRDG